MASIFPHFLSNATKKQNNNILCKRKRESIKHKMKLMGNKFISLWCKVLLIRSTNPAYKTLSYFTTSFFQQEKHLFFRTDIASVGLVI